VSNGKLEEETDEDDLDTKVTQNYQDEYRMVNQNTKKVGD